MLGCEPALWSALVLSERLITLGAIGCSSAVLCHAEPRNGFCLRTLFITPAGRSLLGDREVERGNMEK